MINDNSGGGPPSIVDSTVSAVDKMSCGVPGYDFTAGEYAALIQYHVQRGHFFLAFHFMEAAKCAKILVRMESAAQEFYNI
jgi:hypothetical protein